MTPIEILQHIQHRLTSESPGQVIAALVPRTQTAALTWARRLSGWVEHPFSPQVIAVARVVSQRAMREYGLKLTEDGRVVSREMKGWQDRKPERTFHLAVNGEEISVEFTPDYFPGTDLLSFVSPKPHCLSETGHWSQFVPRDVVEALGGSEAFAAQYAEAKLQGTDQQLMAVFEGKRPEMKPRRKPAPPANAPVVGEHTSRVVAEPEPVKQSVQGMLF